jgi:hypothetical protein
LAAPLKPDVKAAIRHLVIDKKITSPSVIADRLDIGRVAARNYIRECRAEGESPPAPATPKVVTIDETADRIARTRDLRRERDELLAVAGEKSFRAYLESIVRDVAPRFEPIPPMPAPEFDEDTSSETLLMLLSDWHAFEEVKSDRVMGFNEFNGPILCERVRRLLLTQLSIKDRLERGGGWSIRRAEVACNGDFVSGTIHELERHSDASNVVHAVFATGELLAAYLRDMAPHFDEINVRCTSGNHGRLPDARRMQQKDPTRNWDTVIYLFAMSALRDVPNVRFHIPDSYFVRYEIERWSFLQFHGHDIKSWNAIPYYGIDRFGRNMNALHNSRSERIDYFLVSHFHSLGGVPSSGGETFVNGSVIGGTEFSVGALGKCDRPAQWMFLVHQDHGITGRWPLLAEGRTPVQPYPLPEWPVVG